MDKYELGIAVQKVYDFIWEEFCDWYIEIVKVRLYKKKNRKAANAALGFENSTDNALRCCIHICRLSQRRSSARFVRKKRPLCWLRGRNTPEEWNFAKERADVETIKVLVKGIRNIRSR